MVKITVLVQIVPMYTLPIQSLSQTKGDVDVSLTRERLSGEDEPLPSMEIAKVFNKISKNS